MKRLKTLFSHSLAHYAWKEFLVRYRFKYVLPHITETTLDGIRLDLSPLSLKVRNRLLMGIYEANEKQMCLEFLSANDSVLEIGGAIGFVGLVCQKKIGIRYYSICEANPRTLEILRRNYRLNGLEPVAWNIALGPDDRTLDLEVESDFWENSILARGVARQGQTIRVPGATLPTILTQVARPVNVLIIDVEGAEQFIRPEHIPSTVEKIIVEMHPDVLGAEKSYDFISSLIQKGFRVAREQESTFAFLKRGSPAVRSGPPERLDGSNGEPELKRVEVEAAA